MTKPAVDMKSIFAHGLACLLIFAGNACNIAQDDPFGAAQPDTGNVAQPDVVDAGEPPEINVSLPSNIQLIMRAVIESKPTTAIEFAKSVRTLMDIEAYEHARYYLNQMVVAKPTDEQLFSIESTLGSSFLMRLLTDANMQPNGREFAENAISGAKRAAFHPQRFEKLIAKLSHENISIRSEAFRSLRRLGAPAAAQMINVFADPAREKEFPYIRGALNKFGDEAIQPLLGAVRADNLQVQVEAVRALHHYQSSDARIAMFRAYLSPQFPESVRRSALDTMMTKYNFAADPQQAEKELYQYADAYLMGRRRLPGEASDMFTIWRWDTQSNKLEPHVVARITADRIMAADRAADLYEIQQNSLANRQLYLITLLESAKRQVGPGEPVDFEDILSQIWQASQRDVEAALDKALELGLIPAAIGACEVLEQIGTSEVLLSENHRPSPLVRALLSGNRYLQFAAFKAVDGIDPRSAFAGSSYMTKLAVYLSGSRGIPAGLVGNNRVSTAQTYAAALNQSGMYGLSAGSSREFFKAAISNPDLEILLISDSLSRPDFLELVQQLRTDWRTKDIPIGVLVRNDDVGRRANRVLRNDPELLVLPAVFDSDRIGSYVTRLQELIKPWPITPQARRVHAYAATKWLAKVASDRESFKFWNLGQYQNELTQLIYVQGFAEYASEILAGLGTPLAQKTLVDFASQNSIPLEDRQVAARAFAKSVNRSGTLLTSSEIDLQYKRYNASENEPKSTQSVLATILDAIEKRSDQVSSKTN